MAIIQVFTAATNNANSSEITLNPEVEGMVRLFADGTFDSGVLRVQINPETSAGTWHNADSQTITSAGFIDVPVSGAKRLRVNLASVAAASALLDSFINIPDAMLDSTQTDN